jgi:hypothetical protein
MAKYQAKTTENKTSVASFLKNFPAERQKDAKIIIKMMEEASGFKAKMWGPAIIGFGSYHYIYESGHEGDSPLIAFSPRKTEFALYLSSQFDNRSELLKKFGKHKASKACLYIKKVEDIDTGIFGQMIYNSLQYVIGKHDVKGCRTCLPRK